MLLLEADLAQLLVQLALIFHEAIQLLGQQLDAGALPPVLQLGPVDLQPKRWVLGEDALQLGLIFLELPLEVGVELGVGDGMALGGGAAGGEGGGLGVLLLVVVRNR